MSATFHKKLLKWFDSHGRKNLPWQIDKTPYRVWVSEIMLQQTQVKTVIPYFENFMQRFPNVHRLATASTDEVMHAWAGLGYYARARHLHAAAKKISHEYRGNFPSTLEEINALPGIGLSTAGAILAIAFEKPTAILDGNVKRVLSRYKGITDPIDLPAVDAALWQFANALLPKNRSADYTQALMDLGATVCTRTQPNCSACPFTKQCYAHQHQLTSNIPIKKTKAKLPTRDATLLVLRHKSRILLSKRKATGIWGGLWSLPELKNIAPLASIQAFCREELNLQISHATPLTSFRHTFTHYHLNIHPMLIEVKSVKKSAISNATLHWYDSQSKKLGLPRPVERILTSIIHP